VQVEREVQDTPEWQGDLDALLTAAEVATLFRVSSKTVGRWGSQGNLPLYRTIGGHHRYRLSDVRAFLELRNDDQLRTD
jgi:excisionase family DNA binding protein